MSSAESHGTDSTATPARPAFSQSPVRNVHDPRPSPGDLRRRPERVLVAHSTLRSVTLSFGRFSASLPFNRPRHSGSPSFGDSLTRSWARGGAVARVLLPYPTADARP